MPRAGRDSCRHAYEDSQAETQKHALQGRRDALQERPLLDEACEARCDFVGARQDGRRNEALLGAPGLVALLLQFQIRDLHLLAAYFAAANAAAAEAQAAKEIRGVGQTTPKKLTGKNPYLNLLKPSGV